ncbi:hypothetical protein FRB95_009413 [Tulasnella sp. JGI-2019a]|nr:hypothetical protein FRB95_009413 [Tulasnella sp. JGI-2019a]
MAEPNEETLNPLEAAVGLPGIDPSKLTITRAETLKPLPPHNTLVFGQSGSTDHMLVIEFDPESGWSAPAIKPYAPLSLDPASSVFHYAPAVFEGMKAHRGPDGRPRLFRPDMNMARMERSADRVALPPFDGKALLELIRKLVAVEDRWIPSIPGYALYIRPTYIGTRPAIGVQASTHGMIFVICSSTGPYFPTGFKPITLIANSDYVRAWPGGTGEFKLALNYSPCFKPQMHAAKNGYQQILWLLGEERKVTEVGQMNFFIVLKRADGADLDLITPALDGTILPGVTRDSILALGRTHTPNPSSCSSLSTTNQIIPKIYTHEKSFTMPEFISYLNDGTLLEAFGCGTASILCPVSKIGYEGKDLVLPVYEEGVGPVSKALWQRMVDIQEGRRESEWSVLCE